MRDTVSVVVDAVSNYPINLHLFVQNFSELKSCKNVI